MTSNRTKANATSYATRATAIRCDASNATIVWKTWLSAVLLVVFAGTGSIPAEPTPHGAQPIPESAIPALVREAVGYQLDDFHHTSWGLRYRVHRVDSKEDSVRDLVESSEGNVARTLQRHGQPLTAEETEAEAARLRSLSPADMKKHRRGSESSDKYGEQLMRAMPNAMLYTLVAGQPQLPGFPANQVVLDFAPNPAFHPATTAESVLPGLAGRLWIDGETHHAERIELRIIRNVNVMMGLLIRLYPGGTLVYEQRPAGGGHYAYSHIEIDVRLRELMVRTVPYHSTFDATAVQYLPNAPSLKEAVTMLLSDPPRP